MGKQTLTHSLKTRLITKNNFGMPKISNNKFIPVNKSEAKGQIYRKTIHDTEVDDYIKREYESGENFQLKKDLSDPFFAQKLDEREHGRDSFMRMMTDNPEQQRHKKKTALYDYQKI